MLSQGSYFLSHGSHGLEEQGKRGENSVRCGRSEDHGASPPGLESNSAAFYFGGLGQMNELSVHFLFSTHKKMMLSALLSFCELQEPN
jgi:hypothetical protein